MRKLPYQSSLQFIQHPQLLWNDIGDRKLWRGIQWIRRGPTVPFRLSWNAYQSNIPKPRSGVRWKHGMRRFSEYGNVASRMVVRPLTPAHSGDLVLNCFCPALQPWDAVMHPKVTEEPWNQSASHGIFWWRLTEADGQKAETSIHRKLQWPNLQHTLRCILLSIIWEQRIRHWRWKAVKSKTKSGHIILQRHLSASCFPNLRTRPPRSKHCRQKAVKSKKSIHNILQNTVRTCLQRLSGSMLKQFCSITFLTCSCAGVPAPQKKAAKNYGPLSMMSLHEVGEWKEPWPVLLTESKRLGWVTKEGLGVAPGILHRLTVPPGSSPF